MNVMDCQKLTAPFGDEQVLEFEYVVKDREPSTFSVRQRHYNSLNSAKRFFRDKYFADKELIEPNLMIDWVEWGPIYKCKPKQVLSEILPKKESSVSLDQHYQKALETLTSKAFR